MIRTILILITLTASFGMKGDERGIHSILDAYFHAVTTRNVENILNTFLEDASVQTAERAYNGRAQIREFYENGLLKCMDFYPMPQTRQQTTDSIAVEIGLNCDGAITIVGDFFYFKDDKIARLYVYTGPKIIG